MRRTPFTFNAYDVKAMLEKQFAGGGFVRFTIKHGDKHFPYYADMPFRVATDGTISSVPSLDLKRDDVGIDEDFFDLGGDSLQATEMLLEIEEVTKQAISPSDIRFAMLGLPTPDTVAWQQGLARVSPGTLYGEAVVAMLSPDAQSLTTLLAQFQGPGTGRAVW